MNSLVTLIGTIFWLAGIVLAKGFWSVTAAILIPFWGWYLVVEQVIQRLV